MPTLFKQLQTGRDHEPEPPGSPVSTGSSRRSSRSGASQTTQARVEARKEFLRITNKGTRDEAYTNPESLPPLDLAYNTFQRIYPKFSETWPIDDLRYQEYYHLQDGEHVCMDYCGFGLFSYYQHVINKASSSFGLAYISANLPTHALYGAAEEGSVEFYIRKRVMEYLNINDSEYTMVFTASRGSAFKLLAESYPFHLNQKLLTVYDFESEAVNWMAECARQKGAKIMSACFKWPTLRIGTSDLKKRLQEKKKKNESATGLFVFPVQSRMTGAKYSFQWMAQAQQQKWHVLLDASALGPKDMDSLGLSLFRPDFIVSSFYKVFGIDPTGFGCLFIKKSAINSLHNSSRARAVGMVRIVSITNRATDRNNVKDTEDDDVEEKFQKRDRPMTLHDMQDPISFSGPYFKAAEGKLKNEDIHEMTHKRAAKSWKRRSGISSEMGRSSRSTGFLNDPRGRVSEIEEEDPTEIDYGSQPRRSRYYSERRASEIEEESIQESGVPHYPQLARSQNGEKVNEFPEMEDDRMSNVGNSARAAHSQLSLSGRVSEIDGASELPRSTEFQPFRRSQSISEISEADYADPGIEEPGQSGRSSKASPTEGRTRGRGHSVSFDGNPNGEVSDIGEDMADPESNTINVSCEIKENRFRSVENIDRNVSDDGDLRQDPRLDWPKENGEIGGRNHSAEEQDHTFGDEVRRAENSGCLVMKNEAGSSSSREKGKNEAEELSFIHRKIQPFGGRSSFTRLTGKQLSDFQEIGVLGLVQKFQTLTGSEVEKKSEDTSESKADVPLLMLTGTGQDTDHVASSSLSTASEGERSCGSPMNVVEARAKDVHSQYVNPGESGAKTSEVADATSQRGGSPTGSVEGARGDTAKDSREHSGGELLNRDSSPKGNFPRDREKILSVHEGNFNQGEEAAVETNTKEIHEGVGRELSVLLDKENSVGATLDEDDALALLQRLAAVRQREREALSRPNAKVVLASSEGEDDHWSQDEECTQDRLVTFARPTLEGGKSPPIPPCSETRVEDQEQDASDLSQREKSAVQGGQNLFLATSLSFSQLDGQLKDGAGIHHEFDTVAQKDLVLWSNQGAGRSAGTDFPSGSVPARRLTEGATVDEPSRSSAPRGLLNSIPFRLEEGRTYNESSEESFITLLPSRSGKSWNTSKPEPMSEAKAPGSEESLDKETCSMGKRDLMSVNDDASSPEGRHEEEHVGERRLFDSSRKSPSVGSDGGLPLTFTAVHDMPTSWMPPNISSYGRWGSTEDMSFDTADFHDAKEQHWRNGRSDLRSNRTLSRDVNFEDDTHSRTPSDVSEMLTVKAPATLAEDLARIDMEDSDEESYFQLQHFGESGHGSSASRYRGDELPSASYREGYTDEEYEDIPEAQLIEDQREEVIVCKGLDFADSLGLTKLNYRLRYLINWLVNSLLKLRHPGPNEGIGLVRIYGPKVKFDRGASVSFNMFDWKGLLIQPALVQRLADRSNISLGVGRLCNIVDPEMSPDFMAEKERLLGADRVDIAPDASPYSVKSEHGRTSVAGKNESLRIPVVTAALSFLTSFEDVYKLWNFLAKFLDADFVSKEVWRYHSLNQQTVLFT